MVISCINLELSLFDAKNSENHGRKIFSIEANHLSNFQILCILISTSVSFKDQEIHTQFFPLALRKAPTYILPVGSDVSL